MTVSDPIADLIVRIKNGIAAEHKYVDCPLSKQKVAILSVLKELGFINDFIINEELTAKLFVVSHDARSPCLS
ncbi:MAG: 30S ribosomal protein S8 [Chlamydiae bacterium]|nr:30S ribosomal protein S8 [Chlamydiota bacterium]